MLYMAHTHAYTQAHTPSCSISLQDFKYVVTNWLGVDATTDFVYLNVETLPNRSEVGEGCDQITHVCVRYVW